MSYRDPVPTPPILPDRLGVALGRLQAALGRLQAVSSRPAAEASLDRPGPAADATPRLLEERDAALARAAALQAANAAALQRLERVETAIATVMQGLLGHLGSDPHDAPPGPR